MDARTASWIDQQTARLTQIIRQHGWSIQYIGGAECSVPGCACEAESPFAYTVGLFGMGHPELLIFGVSTAVAVEILDGLSERVRAGDHLLPGQAIDWGHRRLVVESVPNPGDIVFLANDFYRRPDAFSVPVLQVTYADEQGRFPWDAGCTVADQQPRPGTFTA